ncbi:MAG: carboxymuconolactone decarboxylase family protein [Chloroflexi bacterium]|nr:carboxymuconolactone decarboxylase family protein [Chloroflexota bacterium]
MPEIYTQFRRDHTQIGEACDAVAGAIHEAGPPDQCTRRLVKLAVAVGAEAEGAVRSHVRKGLDESITPPKIEHAIRLSLTVAGFPSMIAALKWAREVFEARD